MLPIIIGGVGGAKEQCKSENSRRQVRTADNRGGVFFFLSKIIFQCLYMAVGSFKHRRSLCYLPRPLSLGVWKNYLSKQIRSFVVILSLWHVKLCSPNKCSDGRSAN